MAHEAETSTVNDGSAWCELPDVTSLSAATVLAGDDSALTAAIRRFLAEADGQAPTIAAFANFAPLPPSGPA